MTQSIAEAVFLSDRILHMGANPGRVCEQVEVARPAARNAQLRSDPHFLQLVAQVSRRFAALSA